MGKKWGYNKCHTCKYLNMEMDGVNKLDLLEFIPNVPRHYLRRRKCHLRTRRKCIYNSQTVDVLLIKGKYPVGIDKIDNNCHKEVYNFIIRNFQYSVYKELPQIIVKISRFNLIIRTYLLNTYKGKVKEYHQHPRIFRRERRGGKRFILRT